MLSQALREPILGSTKRLLTKNNEFDTPSKNYALPAEYQEIHDALALFGLGEKEITIYVMLLLRGAMKAKDLSKDVGMHRLDVYNALKVLQSEEFVSGTLSRPMSFKAAPFEKILETLKRKYEEDSRNKASSILRLESIGKSIAEYQKKVLRTEERDDENLLVLSGRKAISERWTRLIASASKEIIIAATAKGTSQILLIQSLDTIYEKTRAGLNVRIFTPISNENVEQLKIIEKEVRHLATSGSGGVCVVDESHAMMIVESPPAQSESFRRTREDNAIVTNSTSMAAMLRTLFFVGWDTSPTLEEQVGRISIMK
jgi:sugar-specific transcriptional regulator TrmB